MSDPVAEKSGFLRMYMSNHPDTLVAYAKWYGQIPDIISSAEMIGIDTKSMTLRYTLKNGGEKKDIRIPLDPPLSGYDDVKPRLLEMKAIAQEGLGMISTPKITSFQFPVDAWRTAAILLPLCYVTFFPKDNTSVLFAPARFLFNLIGSYYLKIAWATLVILHTFESYYTYTLCRKHSTGIIMGAAYVIGTFFFGFPIWTDLRKRIQAARIQSVMKQE